MDFLSQGRAIKNVHLAEICFENKRSHRMPAIFDRLCLLLNVDEYNEQYRTEIRNISRLFCLNFNKKMDEVTRNRQKFRLRYSSWLQQEVKLPKLLAMSNNAAQCETRRARGRPQASFEEASLKTKKRRVEMLVASRTPAELRFAADISTKPSPHDSTLNPYQALALYIDLDLSERKYKLLRSVVNGVHKDCFPSLYSLKLARNAILPSKIIANDICASVNLQELLELTAQSLLKIINLEESKELELICKWGFDGSSGHSQYKQTFTTPSSTDEYLFLIALVPLKLTDVGTGKDVWVNPRPSSTLYCRPIKFIFQKEDPNLVRSEETKMNEAISQLQTFEILLENDQRMRINFKMLFTMVDGSVCNILSNTNATSKCFICGATPKEMNTEKIVNRPPVVEQYRFGLSTLHSWIRFFECVLHIGYRLPIKTWQVRGKEHKEIVKANKNRIQSEFKSKLGLLVDKPKPGYGSSNDGNTARRFFSRPDISSEITGVSKDLIIKFSIILRVLASRHPINLDTFKLLLDETRILYLKLYGWFYMPSSVHKILIHGCEIIASFSLPIGQLSEEALEARHKEVRRNRLNHTRKCSRTSSNFDLIKILLLTSEPLISSRRQTGKNYKKSRFKDDDGEIQKFFKQPDESSTSPIELDDLNLMELNTSDTESEESD